MPSSSPIDAEWLSYRSVGRSRDIHTQLTPETVKQHNTSDRVASSALPRVIVEARDVSNVSDQRNESYYQPTAAQPGSNGRSRDRSGQPEQQQRHRSQSVMRMGGRNNSNGDASHKDESAQRSARIRSHTLSPPHVRNGPFQTSRTNSDGIERDSVEVVLTAGADTMVKDGLLHASDTQGRKQDPMGKSTSSKSHSTHRKSHPSSNDDYLDVSSPTNGADHDMDTPRSGGFETSPIYNKVRLREANKHRSTSNGRGGGPENPAKEASMAPPSLDAESPHIVYDYTDAPSHSSLTSSASARREEHNEMTRHPHRHSKPLLQPPRQHKHGSIETGHNRPEPERYLDTAMLKKQRQSLLRKAELNLSSHKHVVQGVPSETTEISLTDASAVHGPGGIFRTLSTPRNRALSETSVSASPNVIYQALRTGNSGTLSQLLVSPHNLSEALRGSTQSESSVFGDFHNPSSTIFEHADDEDPNVLLDPSHTLSRSGGTRSSRAQHDDAVSVVTTTSSVLKQRLVLKSESRSFDSSEEMSYYHYVSRHSILQLCTEDLMSDNWKLVDYALYRLCEVCCTTGPNGASPLSPVSRGAFDPNRASQDPTENIEQQHKTAAANRIRFIKAGGHALIVGVMKKFAAVADLQTSACRLIQNLFSLDQEGAFKELFSSVYGMDCVLAAIHQFSNGTNGTNYDEVHRYACGALVAIVCSSFKMVQRLMQDPRNLRVFLDAMHYSVPNESSTMGVCRVIHYISKYPDYHKAILTAGGLEEMMAEMKLYPESKKVQSTGCEALGNMVKNTRIVTTTVVEHIVHQLDGAHLIGVAMKTFPEWEDLQEKGAYALFYLSVHKSVQTPMKKAAGLSVLGMALENFPHNKLIQEHGCGAMKRLLEGGSGNGSTNGSSHTGSKK